MEQFVQQFILSEIFRIDVGELITDRLVELASIGVRLLATAGQVVLAKSDEHDARPETAPSTALFLLRVAVLV